MMGTVVLFDASYNGRWWRLAIARMTAQSSIRGETSSAPMAPILSPTLSPVKHLSVDGRCRPQGFSPHAAAAKGRIRGQWTRDQTPGGHGIRRLADTES